MTYDIRPLSFSEIFDRAFRVYIDNFILLFGISVLFWIPTGMLRASTSIAGHPAAITVELILFVIAQPVIHAASIFAVASVYLDRTTTISEAYKSVRPIVVRLLGTYLLWFATVVMSVVAAVGTFEFSSTYLTAASLATGSIALLFPAAIVIGIYFLVCWSLLGSVMVIERRFGWLALRRSRALVVGSWWRTFGVVLTAVLVAALPIRTLRFIWGFIPVVGGFLSGLTAALISPYSTVALVIYYFDRRCRTEDFDLRLLAEQVRAETQTAMATAPGSSALA